MHTITQFGAYEDGEAAARRLIHLFGELGRDFDRTSAADPQDLASIFAHVWQENRLDREYPSVVGFLTTLLRDQDFDGEIIQVWGASDFLSNQSNYAPVCELPSGSGLIQFAYWTGDYSDGDAWCIDIRGDRVVCVPVGGPESREEALSDAYGIFPDFFYLESYLRCSAERRGWLNKQ